jgi:Disulfide bond formation protein DsbB
MPRFLMRGIVVGLAGLGVAGQVVAGLLLVVAVLAAVGVRTPLAFVRKHLEGFELWLAFLVAALAVGGSLFFSEVAHFPPCELCWYQRICMYPLSVATLVVAAFGARRAARWLLPLPVVGACLSVYHILIEYGLAPQTIGCLSSSPCALTWILEFGYVTIPTLALTAFALVFAFLLFGALDTARGDA